MSDWNGLPDQPERSRWHWVALKSRPDHWYLRHWNSVGKWWTSYSAIYPSRASEEWVYGGRPPNPSELAQMRKDEREWCALKCESLKWLVQPDPNEMITGYRAGQADAYGKSSVEILNMGDK